jgi:hypothetical protein
MRLTEFAAQDVERVGEHFDGCHRDAKISVLCMRLEVSRA